MNEHSFARKIVSKCKPDLSITWKINDNYAGGVPDALFIGDTTSVWVEFKWLKELPKKANTLVKAKLTKPQLSWMKKLKASNNLAIAVVGLPGYCIVFSHMEEIENGIEKQHCELIRHQDLVDWIIKTCNS